MEGRAFAATEGSGKGNRLSERASLALGCRFREDAPAGMQDWQLEELSTIGELGRRQKGKEVGGHDQEDPLEVGPSSRAELSGPRGDGSAGLC